MGGLGKKLPISTIDWHLRTFSTTIDEVKPVILKEKLKRI